MNKEQPKEISNHDDSCFKMTKERASGNDIIETQRTIIVPQKNGTEKKTVVKYQIETLRQGQEIQITMTKASWAKENILRQKEYKLKRSTTFLITYQERMKIHRPA